MGTLRHAASAAASAPPAQPQQRLDQEENGPRLQLPTDRVRLRGHLRAVGRKRVLVVEAYLTEGVVHMRVAGLVSAHSQQQLSHPRVGLRKAQQHRSAE